MKIKYVSCVKKIYFDVKGYLFQLLYDIER